jgi:IS4 transposase
MYVYRFYIIMLVRERVCIVRWTGCDDEGDSDYGDSGNRGKRANSKTIVTRSGRHGPPVRQRGRDKINRKRSDRFDQAHSLDRSPVHPPSLVTLPSYT